jgi:hypothetical protein
VGAGDREQTPLGAELGEELASVHDALPALPRPDELGVVVGDRGRDHYLGAGRDEGGVVADRRFDPGRLQALGVRGRSPVRARDRCAEAVGDER